MPHVAPAAIPIDLLVEHTLLRMTILGQLHRFAISKLPGDDLSAICRKLCLRNNRFTVAKDVEHIVTCSSFYRFADAFGAIAKEVHAEFICGGGLPALMTPDEVAESLRVASEDVQHLIESGSLGAIQVEDHHRINREALLDFVKVNPINPKPRNNKGRYVSNNSARTSAQRPASTDDIRSQTPIDV